jgi:Fe-S cluster assembly iron-binding protein IscA
MFRPEHVSERKESPVLTLTENADAIVSTIVTQQGDGADAGLRIQTAEGTGLHGEPRFAVHVVPAPEAADQVVEATGARVFLEDAAAAALADKVLDAGVDDAGAVSFALLAQP